MAVRPSVTAGAVMAVSRSGPSTRLSTPVLPSLKQSHKSHAQRHQVAALPPSLERVQLASDSERGVERGAAEPGDMGRWPLVFTAFLHANVLAEEEVQIPAHSLADCGSVQGAHDFRDSSLLSLVAVSGEETSVDVEQANWGKLGQHVLAVATSDPPGTTTQLQSNLEPKPEGEKRDDYYVNVGYAIRTLREELPTLFYRDMTYDIYREDITFQDPMNTFRGIDNYRLIFKALRFHGRIFFKALWVDVLRVWQPNDRTIQIRWSVRGIPRLPWEAHGRFDGTSEYKLDSSGKIYSHKVDNIVMSDPPKYQPLTVMELLRLSGAQTTPTISCSCSASSASLPSERLPPPPPPPPASPSLSGSLSLQRLVAEAAVVLAMASRFTWIRFYCALSSTLALQGKKGGDSGEEELAASSG